MVKSWVFHARPGAWPRPLLNRVPMGNSWLDHGVKWYMDMHNSGTGAWSKHVVKGYSPMAGIKAWSKHGGKMVHEHEQFRNRRMVKAWSEHVVKGYSPMAGIKAWSKHVVKWYMDMHNSGTGAWSKHGQSML